MADKNAVGITNETNISEQHNKLSNKQKKALWKKQRRKAKRQAIAIERDAEKLKEQEARKNSPSYQAKLKQEEWEEQAELLQIADESRRQNELWLWHEELFAEKLKKKKEQEERERLQKLEIERKIKEEWEERQKKEKEEEEERRKKKEKQEELLRQAREAENKDGDWHNPIAPVRYGQERQIETCPFFAKVGACRFGDRCSRGHPLPESGHTLMFSSMFKHFQLDQGLCEEYDTDIVLEYEDSEVYQKFREFYEDTLPEFKASGQVTQFKVCCNYQAHLRGNVYVSYSREDEALKAYLMFNARWYGGKQLTAQFVNIPSWRRAICGLYAKGRCPKGKECNFLHVFKNPSSEFNMADRDMESFTPRRNSERRQNNHRPRSRSRDRKRRHSRSPSSRKYRHSRSRSRDRHSRYRRSSRRSRSHERSKSKDRSRSGRYRSRSGSPQNDLSSNRSRDRKTRSRSHERYSRSRSKDRSRSGRHRSRSGSPQNDLSSHGSQDRKSRSSYSRERSKKKKKNNKREDDVEEVWIERTVDNNSNENNAAYKSRSSSRERSVSRSSSVTSERKRHKKKRKHSKDVKD